MAVELYRRIDLEISLRIANDGHGRLMAGCMGEYSQQNVPRESIDHFRKHADRILSPNLASFNIDLSDALNIWRREVRNAQNEADPTVVIPRVTVAVDDPRLSLIFWEWSVAELFTEEEANVPVVRTTPVLTRIETAAYTFPMRIVQVGPQRFTHLEEVFAEPIASISWPLANRLAEVGVCEHFRTLEQWLKTQGRDWATADVLHFDFFGPASREWTVDDVLTTARPEEPGTLGWLTRLTDRWQTRLVVLDCSFDWVIHAYGLATGLVRRGGPAVLLRHVEASDARPVDPFYTTFYETLLRDTPIDQALCRAAAATEQNPAGRFALFAGAGREDALRFSQIAAAMQKFAAQWFNDTPKGSRDGLVRELLDQEDIDLRSSKERVDVALDAFQRDWPSAASIDRSFHWPLLKAIDSVKSAARMEGPQLLGARRRKAMARVDEKADEEQEPRFVIASLGTAGTENQFQRMEPEQEFVQLQRRYQLGVHIGRGDPQAIGVVGLFEEAIKWSDDVSGTWLEVGVTSLDFEVIGDPVQELWLPRDKDEPSDRLSFVVFPRHAGVCLLRFCVYYQHNVLQSYRLVAWVQDGSDDKSADPDRAAMAEALQLRPEQFGDASYYFRCEYSLSKDLQKIPDLPQRALSIVTNRDLNGRSVVTMKGPDVFRITMDNNLPTYVAEVRRTLHETSVDDVMDPDPIPVFGSTDPNARNKSTPEILQKGITKLAGMGWYLYDQVAPNDPIDGRKKLQAILKTADSTIHVANVFPDKVIPWGLVYDRHFDPNADPDSYAVCLAAMPDQDGRLPVTECETDENCLLKKLDVCNRERAAANRKPLSKKTIACPLGFWGFRHVIESPVQQVLAEQESVVQDQSNHVRGNRPALVSVGIDVGLNLGDEHRGNVARLMHSVPESDATLASVGVNRKEIITNLEALDLNVIYLYCHTRGGKGDPEVRIPYLEFKSDGQAGRISAPDFHHDERWRNTPLVFLNGCGTAAFTPDALSPFITKFVQGRGAAGIIGTEIPVLEELAGEFGLRFLAHFLRGCSAGDAVMRVRRELLAQNNPLGLAYTLYAPAELSLESAPRADRLVDVVLAGADDQIKFTEGYVIIGGVPLQRSE